MMIMQAVKYKILSDSAELLGEIYSRGWLTFYDLNP